MPGTLDGLVIRKIGDQSVVIAPGKGALALDEQTTEVLGLCEARTTREEAVRILRSAWGLSESETSQRVAERLAWLRDRGVLASVHMPSRSTGAIVSAPMAGEVVVVSSGRAYLLNPSAAQIFSACDGHTPVAEVAAQLSGEGADRPAAEQAVWMGLEALQRSGLLGPEAVLPKASSRRSFLQRWGACAALVPLITSQVLPPPAAAVSACIQGGTPACNAAFPGRISSCVPCCGLAPCSCTGISFCVTRFTKTGAGCGADPVGGGNFCASGLAAGTSAQQACGGPSGAESFAANGSTYICCQCP